MIGKILFNLTIIANASFWIWLIYRLISASHDDERYFGAMLVMILYGFVCQILLFDVQAALARNLTEKRICYIGLSMPIILFLFLALTGWLSRI